MNSNLYDTDGWLHWIGWTSAATLPIDIWYFRSGWDQPTFQGKYADDNKLVVKRDNTELGSFSSMETIKNTLNGDKTIRNNYDVITFSYNWLGDVNTAAKELEKSINERKYKKVILITHSTGGLVASTYIASSRLNAAKVEKTILLASALDGTLSSLYPVETGTLPDYQKITDTLNWIWKKATIKYNITGVIRDLTKNSAVNYQLLPSWNLTKAHRQSGVKSIDDFYSLMNRSPKINTLLTNNTTDKTKNVDKKTHMALRNTLGDKRRGIVPTLYKTDTYLIGNPGGNSKDGMLTPDILTYDTNGKYKGIKRNYSGDGMILGDSTLQLANTKYGKVIKNVKFYGVTHSGF